MKVLDRKGSVVEVDEDKLAWELHNVMAAAAAKLLVSKGLDLDGENELEVIFSTLFSDMSLRIKEVRTILSGLTDDNFFRVKDEELKRAKETKMRLADLARELGISAERIEQHDRLLGLSEQE